MPSLVVDASVAVKWFLPEDHAELALGLLRSGASLLAPEFLRIEVTNVLWKRSRRGDIHHDVALRSVEALLDLPLLLSSSESLLAHALALGLETGRTVYDSLYLALAIDMEVPLVTADERFYNALRGTRFGTHVRWIEDQR